jgi:O-antigen/teichoic acid export membrane protein
LSEPAADALSGAAGGDLAPGHGPIRNTFFALLSRIFSAAFTIVLALFLVRKLGPTDYGVLALAVSIGTILALVSDLGITLSASRFAAENPRDRAHAAGVLRTALWLKLIASLVATVVLVLIAPLLADAFDTPALTLPLRLIAIAAAAQGFGGVIYTWFTALGRVSNTLGYTLVESSVETTASICLVLLGSGAAGAVAGRAMGYTAAAILVGVLAVRMVGWPALRDAQKGFLARQIATYGVALLIIDGVFVIFDRVDVLIIGALLSTTSAGTFEAAFRILTFLTYPAFAVGAGFTPRLAEGQRTETETARFMNALRYMILIYLLFAAPVLVWATPVVSLMLGDGYSDSAAVLRAMAPALVLTGLAPVLAAAANFLGEARRRVPIAVGALLVNIVIDLILVPQIGIVAGAIGTSVAYVLYTGGHVRICQEALGVSFSSLLPTVGRGLIAGAVAALPLFAMGTHHLSPLEWIAGSALALTGFVGALVLLRELSMQELRAALDLLRGSLRRRSRRQAADS